MKIKIDTNEINNAIRDIAVLFDPHRLENIPPDLISRVRVLVHSGDLKNCIASLGSSTTADDHVIRFGVCGELLDIVQAARALRYAI